VPPVLGSTRAKSIGFIAITDLVGNRNANLRRVAIVDILATTALLTAALIDHTT
jgi:hypothetical protein